MDIVVLDIETLHSPDELETGWKNKPALGLSLGGYLVYEQGRIIQSRIRWFERQTLERAMAELVAAQPLLVTFNGIAFDGPLMRGLLRLEAEHVWADDPARASYLSDLCDQFKQLCAVSYDILAEVWRADPGSRHTRGLNGLDALCRANRLSVKPRASHEIPRLWKDGDIETVIEYCRHDLMVTAELFELIMSCGGRIARANGGLTLRMPEAQAEPHNA